MSWAKLDMVCPPLVKVEAVLPSGKASSEVQVGGGIVALGGQGWGGGSVWQKKQKRWPCSNCSLGRCVEEALRCKSWREVGGWVVFRKVSLWEAQFAELGLSGVGISELGRG